MRRLGGVWVCHLQASLRVVQTNLLVRHELPIVRLNIHDLLDRLALALMDAVRPRGHPPTGGVVATRLGETSLEIRAQRRAEWPRVDGQLRWLPVLLIVPPIRYIMIMMMLLHGEVISLLLLLLPTLVV